MTSPIWNKLSFLLALFPGGQRSEVARRWYHARTRDPELASDILRLGGVLTAQPFQAGQVADLDPARLAYEAGRRDLALQLTAMMGLTIEELNILMEMDDNAPQPR